MYVLPITTWLSYSNRKCLKKRHFPDLICAVLNLNLKKHLVCHQVQSTQTDGKQCKVSPLARCPISHSQRYLMGHKVFQWSPQKVDFSGHSIFSRFSNHYNWVNIYYQESPEKEEFSGPTMFSTCNTYYSWVKLL